MLKTFYNRIALRPTAAIQLHMRWMHFVSDFLISFPCCQSFTNNIQKTRTTERKKNEPTITVTLSMLYNEFMHFITVETILDAHTASAENQFSPNWRRKRVIKIMNKQSGIYKKPTLLECCTDWIKLILLSLCCCCETTSHWKKNKCWDINCTYWILCANKIL